MVMAWMAVQFTRVNVEFTVVLGLYKMDTLCMFTPRNLLMLIINARRQ
jgi:hypothetical protein